MKIKLIPEFNTAILTKPSRKAYSKSVSILKPFLPDRVDISEQNKHWSCLVNDLNSYIKPENFLGSGIEADVYKLNDNYVLRLLGRRKSVDKQRIIPIQDVFVGKNYGQAIAVSEDGMASINKFVNGKPLYGPNWSMDKIITKEEYMETFKEIQALPDETFANYMKNIINIRINGYNIETINPNNLLLDGKQLNIIDLTKEKVEPEIKFEDFNSLVNIYQMHTPLRNMSPNEIQDFASEIRVFYDIMAKIAQNEGYEFHIPNLNHCKLQDITTYLYHKDWEMIELILFCRR